VSYLTVIFRLTFLSKKWVTKFPLKKPVFVATDKEIKKRRPSKIHQFTGRFLVPLTLFIIASIANYLQNHWEKCLNKSYSVSRTPVIALFDWANFVNSLYRKKFDRKFLLFASGCGEAILARAPVILITGAGASFWEKCSEFWSLATELPPTMSDANWEFSFPS